LGGKGDELAGVFVDIWPFHLQLLDLDSRALLFLGVLKIGFELPKELISEVYVIWSCYCVEPVSLLDGPWRHRRSLDE
jgi:hypothetical protein